MEKIVDILKYEGDNNSIIWKHPCEDFNSLTQLIVHESQEAVFIMNGQILDIFGAGRYTLETQNIPLIGKILKRTTGDQTPFHCEVYFVNKTEQLAMKWGTDSRIQFVEPTYGFPLSIGASGELSIRVENAKKLLLRIVGTEAMLNRSRLGEFFRAFLITKVKSYIAQIIKTKKINIFEIDAQLQHFSEELHTLLQSDFLDYGVMLEKFLVMNISKPDGESQYENFKALHFRQYADVAEAKLRQQTDLIYAQTEAQKVIIDSQAQATKRAQEGYTYQQERGFDVATEVAKNEATGQFTNLGIGLGTMAGVGGAIAGTVGDAMNNALTPALPLQQPSTCTKCGTPLSANAKFCPECGEKVAPAILADMIVCPACGKNVTKGNFCPTCGHKFVTVCPKCGKDIVADAKFCLECGEKV